jgi:CBS domain-containing protein
MTRGVVSLAPNDDVLAAAELMGRKHIHRVIVVEDDRLVGVVSALDVARAVAVFLEPGQPHRERIHRGAM